MPACTDMTWYEEMEADLKLKFKTKMYHPNIDSDGK